MGKKHSYFLCPKVIPLFWNGVGSHLLVWVQHWKEKTTTASLKAAAGPRSVSSSKGKSLVHSEKAPQNCGPWKYFVVHRILLSGECGWDRHHPVKQGFKTKQVEAAMGTPRWKDDSWGKWGKIYWGGLELQTKQNTLNYLGSQVKGKISKIFNFKCLLATFFISFFLLNDTVKGLNSKYYDILCSHYLKYF